MFDLHPLQVHRHEKVIWRFPENVSDVLASLKSKGLRQFLNTVDEALTQHGISWEQKELTKDGFSTWLPYYEKNMLENNYDIIASLDWYDQKLAQDLVVEGMFFYKNGQLVGSGIFTRNKLEKATFAFKASDRIDLTNKPNSSLGAVIDYFFLREMHAKGVKVISAGRSRNAFGVINSLGYIDYKLRFGYQPLPDETTPPVQEVPLNEAGIVLFYGKRNDGLNTLFAIKPKSLVMNFEVARFATPELPFEIIEY